MEKNKIKKMLKKEHRGIKRRLRGFVKNGDQNKLHQFRVGIKKLKAVATLIEETAGAGQLRKDLRPIKNTYQLSGKVRDSYLHIELGKNVGASSDFLSEEKSSLKKASRKLRKGRTHHLKTLRRSKKVMLKHARGAKNREINLFYMSELHAIHGCLNSSNEVEELHGCRKRLKVLIYNLPLVSSILKLPINEDYLQQVQTAIGDWHDNVLAAEQFPELNKNSKTLYRNAKQLVKDFYERATSEAMALIEKTGR
jgi:CHAD domain-containing protein